MAKKNEATVEMDKKAKALAVIALCAGSRGYLMENDPKALEQIFDALEIRVDVRDGNALRRAVDLLADVVGDREMVAMPVVYECAECGEKWTREHVNEHIDDIHSQGRRVTGFRFDQRDVMHHCPACD